MLPWYIEDYTPRTSVIHFETAKEILGNAEKERIDKKRFEGRKNPITCKIVYEIRR